MKTFLLIIVSSLLLGVESSPQLTCTYADETLKVAEIELKIRDAEFEATKPFTPDREIKAAQCIGLLSLMNTVNEWKKSNCVVH